MTAIDPTPEQRRNLEILLERAATLWELDFKTHEIKRRRISGLRGLLDRLWKPRLPVHALYVWLAARAADETGIAHPHMMDRDSIPFEGLPRKYRLAGGWTIPTYDLKFLRDGPLLDERTGRVLVTAATTIETTILVTKRACKVLAGLIPLGLALVKYGPDVIALLRGLTGRST